MGGKRRGEEVVMGRVGEDGESGRRGERERERLTTSQAELQNTNCSFRLHKLHKRIQEISLRHDISEFKMQTLQKRRKECVLKFVGGLLYRLFQKEFTNRVLAITHNMDKS